MWDKRLKFVPIGCGNCIECRKQKANEWRTRLLEEFKTHEKTYFVTLTINNDTFNEMKKQLKTSNEEISKTLIRRWLERIRKETKKSVKHWLITELGEENERLHFHGFIFDDNIKICIDKWQYGLTYIGEYCTEKTINYCTKYVLKLNEKHPFYKPNIYCSKGIGRNFVDTNKQYYTFKGKDTKEYYTLNDGRKCNLPIYYRNHFYTESEKTKLWQNKLNEKKIYVRGIKCDISTDEGINEYLTILRYQQEQNILLGYGSDINEWKNEKYKEMLNFENPNLQK